MHDEKHHRLRNFFLLMATFGLVWYFVKERDRTKEQVKSLEDADLRRHKPEPEPIVDVAQIEDEPVIEVDDTTEPDEAFEPALVERPEPKDDSPADPAVDLAPESDDDLIDEFDHELEDEINSELEELLDFDDIREQMESALEEGDEYEDSETDELDEEDEAEEELEDEVEDDDETALEEVEEEEVEEEPEEKAPTWVRPVDGKCPEGFPIKARFATGHFHEPGDRGYEKILPDCCYPTVEDAEADGFTASRWA